MSFLKYKSMVDLRCFAFSAVPVEDNSQVHLNSRFQRSDIPEGLSWHNLIQVKVLVLISELDFNAIQVRFLY